jgi:hypothetical protein
MGIAEILQQLERNNGKFPRAAVEAAVERRDEIIPELLRVLEDSIDRAAELAKSEAYMADLYAMFLLAQFREVRAYPLVVRFAALPGHILDDLWGEFLTEDLGRVLASVCGGELAGIQALIEDEDTYEWVRGAALKSLVALVAAGLKSREEIVDYFALLFRGKLGREQSSNVWDELVSCSCDLWPGELIGDIEQAYEEDLVDFGFVGWNEVKQDMAAGKDRALARLAENPHLHLVEETVAEMDWWHCFHREQRERERPAPPAATIERAARWVQELPAPPAATVRQPAPKPKVGRNEPCPCGSGKKFKKCCGK